MWVLFEELCHVIVCPPNLSLLVGVSHEKVHDAKVNDIRLHLVDLKVLLAFNEVLPNLFNLELFFSP